MIEERAGFQTEWMIEEFVDDLSNWYVRRSRGRIGPTAKNLLDKQSFYQTGYEVLLSLSRILAPFTPFLSEEIYRNLSKEESVHLSNWPESGKVTPGQKRLIKEMKFLREVVEKTHAARKKAKIPVKQPLQSIEVVSPIRILDKELLELAKEELNIHEIHWLRGKELFVKLNTQIGLRLKEEAKTRILIRKIQMERKSLGLDLGQKVNLTNPWWPEDKKLRQIILTKTLGRKLNKGNFEVEKVER